MRNIVLIILMALCTLALAAEASYLEGNYERTPSGQTTPPPERHTENPLRRVVRRLRVRDGCYYRGLTVFLLELEDPENETVYVSAEEALAEGTLDVRETGEDLISALRVRNEGRRPVLLLAGEVLLGGKQNRILRDDVLLSPRSGWVRVPVACVEERRWSERSQKFRRRVRLAPQQLRAASQAGRSQKELWQGVRGYHERFGVESESRDLSALRDAEGVQAALRDYRRHFSRHCWRPEVVGMVVARRGRIVGADIFCNTGVFRKHRDRLLDSYAIDCIAHHSPDIKRVPERHRVDREDARRFLRRTLHAQITSNPGHGSGRRFSVEGDAIRGAGLAHRRSLLHAALYPRRIVIAPPPHPIPCPRPPHPRPRPYPRDEPQR
jgi:hypothetical protein